MEYYGVLRNIIGVLWSDGMLWAISYHMEITYYHIGAMESYGVPMDH